MRTISDDVIVDFSGAAGRDDFFRTWGLAEPGPSRLWRDLEEALALGCARGRDGALWAPSFFVQLDDPDDPFSALLAIRPGAALHAAPDGASAVVARLEWDVLTLRPGGTAHGWWPVALADGRSGYVPSGEVRGLLDYRASFRKIGGRWRMTAFVAGD